MAVNFLLLMVDCSFKDRINKLIVMNKATKLLSLTCAVAALLTSCKKDQIPEKDPGSTNDPIPGIAKLEVALNDDYLPAAKIDSALAIWEVNGAVQTIRLTKDNRSLAASLSAFNSGQGTLSVQLYTQSKLDNMPLQWEKQLSHTLNRTSPVRLAAPVSIKDASWSPRAICKSEIHNATFTAIIALRPEDAYFELKEVTAAVAQRIEVVRSFYNQDTTHLVASRGWIGDASKLSSQGNLVDRNHFRSLVEQLDGRPWDRYKIRASFYERISPGRIYEVEFEKPKL